METFADRLHQFVTGLDFVDEDMFTTTCALVEDYLKREIGLIRMEILVAYHRTASNPRQAGEECLYLAREGKESRATRRDGIPQGHAAYAYTENLRLWVTSETPDQVLRQASGFLDHWSAPDQSIDLPAYICPSGAEAATVSILIPFGTPKPMGVLNLECNHQRTRRTRCTATARSQLVRLAEMLGVLTRRYETQLQRQKGCRENVRSLRSRFDTRVWPQLLHPRIFVAFSDRADRYIVKRLRAVVREVAQRYELEDVFWDEINETGNITQAMIERISTCHYGVCYFSEPSIGPGKDSFQDNPNVLFEAGMLHSLTHHRASELLGWVPIRELESPILPFDFAQQRLILIDRTVRNYRRRFEEKLRSRLEELVRAGDIVVADAPATPRDSPFPPSEK